MTREEHRAAAEALVDASKRAWESSQAGSNGEQYAHLAVQQAQVHATLAASVRPLVVHLPADTDFTGDDLHQFAEVLKEALQ